MNNKWNALIKKSAVLLLLGTTLFGGCAQEPISPDGQVLLKEGRYEEALAKLEADAKAHPNDMNYRIALLRSRELIIDQLVADAGNARAADQLDDAQAIYQRILSIDPHNSRAQDGLGLLAKDRQHDKMLAEADGLMKKGNLDEADVDIKAILLENPQDIKALQLQHKLDDLQTKERMEVPTLKSVFKKPVSLQFRDANIKMVFEAISRMSGINILLDKDVRPDLKTSIFVKNISVEDTIDLILFQSNLDKKILSDNTIFVYPNTPNKVKEYQDLVIRSFHLVNAEPKQMLTMLKTVLKTKDIFINEKTNSIVMRDTPAAVSLAEKMIADQDVPDPEVMMEVEVLEVNRTRLTDLGIKWPDNLTLTSPTNVAAAQSVTISNGVPVVTNNNNALPGTWGQLQHTPLNDYQVTPLSLALHLLLQDSDTNILASPRIRARNREKAKIMVGDRVPVITNAVTPVSTGTPVVTGSVQYLDVGLKLEVQPDIHPDNEVAIKINMEVSSIVKEVQNSTSGTLAYQIGTRNASTLLQLKDGETQILGGLIDNEERNSANKVPGLGDLPVVGRLFSEHNGNGSKTEIILAITPHIINQVKQPDARDVKFWSGTDDTLRNKPLVLHSIGAVSVSNPSSTVASVPGAYTPQLKSAVPMYPAPASVAPTQGATKAPMAGSPTSNAPTSASSGQPMTLSWQGPAQAKVGDKISVTLNTRTAQGLKNMGFQVGYDPTVLKLSDVVEGGFLNQDSSRAKFTKAVEPRSGRVQVSLYGQGKGSTGSGSIATLEFEVVGVAQHSPITLSRIVPIGASGEILGYATPEPYSIAVGQ